MSILGEFFNWAREALRGAADWMVHPLGDGMMQPPFFDAGLHQIQQGMDHNLGMLGHEATMGTGFPPAGHDFGGGFSGHGMGGGFHHHGGGLGF